MSEGSGLTRREWLRIGGLAGLGMLAGSAATVASPHGRPSYPGFGKARSVILVFANGGQSQLDTWDPKPEAPEEVRGAFRPIRTAIPGTLFCEHMPHLARVAHLYTVVRTVSHDDLDHGSAVYLALSGRFHPRKSSNPPVRPTDFPTYGAIVQRIRPSQRWPYSAIHVNGPAQIPELLAPGQFAGFLGRAYDPLILGDVTGGTAVPGLDPLPELPPVRISRRRSLLKALDEYRQQLAQNRPLMEMNALYRQAYELLDSPHCQKAFDLSREPRALREQYGMNRSGQACLLARRLVEAGVPWITVIWNHSNRGQDKAPDNTDQYGWDTHNDIFTALKNRLLPRFDQSFSTLLTDLAQRGLLDSTLVVCMGEFGRAPLVARERTFAGNAPGRKHWAATYSIVLAGAGVGRGGTYGESDRQGAYPRSNPITPGDVVATMFSALGIDPRGHFRDATDRPFVIAEGKPIAGVYG
jgi:hypothetical protein